MNSTFNPHDFESFPEEEHPQPSLRTFYRGARVYFILETISAVFWIAQMFAFKFGIARLIGAQYRLSNVLMLFHLGAPLAMQNVVQQTRNNNSVYWWIFIVFFVGFCGDLESLMEAASSNLTRNVLWAWVLYLILAAYNLCLTCFAISWFTYWFYFSHAPDIPLPAALVQFWRAQKRVEKKYPPMKQSLHARLL
jgi:hypothetical protein